VVVGCGVVDVTVVKKDRVEDGMYEDEAEDREGVAVGL
jgi:hypothetical protein